MVLPCTDCGPLHAPLAVHALTPIDDQVSTALSPSTMVVGLTVIVRLGVATGGGGRMGIALVVPNEQLKKEGSQAGKGLRGAVAALAGQVDGPTDVIKHVVEQDFAELLSNPRLSLAIDARFEYLKSAA